MVIARRIPMSTKTPCRWLALAALLSTACSSNKTDIQAADVTDRGGRSAQADDDDATAAVTDDDRATSSADAGDGDGVTRGAGGESAISSDPENAGASGSSGQDAAGQGGAGRASEADRAGAAGAGGACWVMKTWTPDGCGSCEMTMEDFCRDHFVCKPDTLPSCEGLPDADSIDDGCGLLRVRTSGHAGQIYIVSVYDETSGELVYQYDKGGRSSGCLPELTVGEEPSCDDWTTLCEGPGGA
jgi:hypothetical protein